MGLSQEEIDAKLAELEQEPESEEVKVEPEEELDEEEVDSSDTEDDTDLDEPAESAGDEDDDEDEVDLSKSEAGLLKAMKAEREKRKETENELKEIKESLNKLNETVVSSQAPRTLDEAYERDPKGVTENINGLIKQAADNDDIVEVERLRDLKTELQASKQLRFEQKQQTLSKQTEIVTLLKTSVPDFGPEKAKVLTDFAIKELEYTDPELVEMTNIGKHGTAAVKEIIRINKLYEKFQAPAKAKKKKVKRATNVEPGGAIVKSTPTSSKKLLEQARKSGKSEDWAQVIADRFG